MKNNFFFLFFLLQCGFVYSNEIKTSTIANNCISCHGLDFKGNEFINVIDLSDKDNFYLKMKKFKEEKGNSVMHRILKPLTYRDLENIANYLCKNNE